MRPRGTVSMSEVNRVNRGKGEYRERERETDRVVGCHMRDEKKKKKEKREICKLYTEVRLLSRLTEV